MTEKPLPFYQDVDGFRLLGAFSPDAFRSGLKYQPTPEDFFIVTYPKCGTTWTQQIVSLIFREGEIINNWEEFYSVSPFLEMMGLEGIEKMNRPGSIKTHLPFHLTPYSPSTKYLYIARNPKDTVVSFFYHTCSYYYRYEWAEFDDFFELFIDGATDFGEYFDHVLSWYEHRNDDNVMFVTYEEMKRDTRNMVKKIARFMGAKYRDMIENEAFLDKVLKYSSVQHMKEVYNDALEFERPSADEVSGLKYFRDRAAEYQPTKEVVREFIRKGIVGDWRNMLSQEQNRRLDEKIEEKLKGTEIYDYWKNIKCI